MQTSAKGVAFIAGFEGVILKAYRDVAGVLTIGVGHTNAAGAPAITPGMTVTREQAYAILASDLAAVERDVAATFRGVVLTQAQFDAAVSFDFNTGGIHDSTWARRLAAGDVPGAAEAIQWWNRAGGRVVAGLVRRREAEAALLTTGDYGPLDAPSGALSSGEQSA